MGGGGGGGQPDTHTHTHIRKVGGGGGGGGAGVFAHHPSSVPSHMVDLSGSCCQLPDVVMGSGELWVNSDTLGRCTSSSDSRSVKQENVYLNE